MPTMCHHFLQSSDICTFILHYDQEAGLSHVRGTWPPKGSPCLQSPHLKSIYIFMPLPREFSPRHFAYTNSLLKNPESGTFLVVRWSGLRPSNAAGAGVIPGQGAKILHVSRPKDQNIKQKLCCGKFNKDFADGPHWKKKSLKKNQKALSHLPVLGIEFPNLCSIRH